MFCALVQAMATTAEAEVGPLFCDCCGAAPSSCSGNHVLSTHDEGLLCSLLLSGWPCLQDHPTTTIIIIMEAAAALEDLIITIIITTEVEVSACLSETQISAK